MAAHLAFAVPQARVIALPETGQGAFSKRGLALLRDAAQGADAALVGPGLMDEDGCKDFVAALLPLLAHAPVVLDAPAMNALKGSGARRQALLLTPHAGEMAHLMGRSKQDVVADPEQAATSAALRWNSVVALKGATTLFATPAGGRRRHEGGQLGLVSRANCPARFPRC